MKKLGLILAALFFASLGAAQSEASKAVPGEPEKYYRLDFTIKDFEAGKVVSSREYSTSMTNNRPSTSIRSGEKVPIGAMYQDVGTNIDCIDLKQQGDRLSL